jgi:hypothetical protein
MEVTEILLGDDVAVYPFAPLTVEKVTVAPVDEEEVTLVMVGVVRLIVKGKLLES